MHRDKQLPGLDRICDENRCGHFCPPGRHQHSLIGLDAKGLCVKRVHLHIDMVRVQLFQNGGFSRAGLRVPL